MDRSHQVCLFQRFDQEVDHTGLHRPHRGRNVTVSGDEHNVWVRLRFSAVQQVETVDVGKSQVQDEAGGYIGFRVGVVFGGRTERDGVQVVGRQQVGQRLADPPVIVDDQNDMVLGRHFAK